MAHGNVVVSHPDRGDGPPRKPDLPRREWLAAGDPIA